MKSPAELTDNQLHGRIKGLRAQIKHLEDGINYLNKSLSANSADRHTKAQWRTLRHADHLLLHEKQKELEAHLAERWARGVVVKQESQRWETGAQKRTVELTVVEANDIQYIHNKIDDLRNTVAELAREVHRERV